MRALLILAACSAPTKPLQNAQSTPPLERARALVTAQLAAAVLVDPPEGRDPDAMRAVVAKRDDKLHATFATDAVCLDNARGHRAADVSGDALADVAVADLRADGNEDAVWFVASLSPPPADARGDARAVRYAGLATRSSGWKVVACSLVYTLLEPRGSGEVDAGAPPLPDATPPSPLESLVLDGKHLALAPGAIVVDTTSIGGSLGAWAKRTLHVDPNSRAVLDPAGHWGFVQANVAFAEGDDRGNVALFAIATREGTRWTPRFVQYIGH